MSVNPGALFDGSHTYNDFHMIPRSILTFNPPPPKYVLQELAGASGELDYTEVLTNKIVYGNRKGSFEFLVVDDDYISIYETCLAFFDGRKRTCYLDDDPLFHYNGRFKLSEWKSYEGYSLIVIDYDVTPYRYSEDNINLYDWEWDSLDLTSNEDSILYHSFSVDGTKARTFINDGEGDVYPTITCSAAMEVTVDEITYQLPAGTTTVDFPLNPGTTFLTFEGTGTVSLDYAMENEL